MFCRHAIVITLMCAGCIGKVMTVEMSNGGAGRAGGGDVTGAGGGGKAEGGAADPPGDGGGGAAGGTAGAATGGGGGAVSTGGGTGTAGGTAGADDGPPGWVPAIMAVGYGGIRIVSRDNGLTWGDRAFFAREGGDDENLLRAVTYGNGMWIAGGWKLVTSNDGLHWTDHGLVAHGPIPDCNVIEGLAYKDGAFYLVCTPWQMPTAVYRSLDGLNWTRHGTIGPSGAHPSLTYRGGKFVSYGDDGTSYESTDAMTWILMPGLLQATYCESTYKSRSACNNAAWFSGAWLLPKWKAIVSRSTNGQTFSNVYVDDQNNTVADSRAIALGYVSPN